MTVYLLLLSLKDTLCCCNVVTKINFVFIELRVLILILFDVLLNLLRKNQYVNHLLYKPSYKICLLFGCHEMRLYCGVDDKVLFDLFLSLQQHFVLFADFRADLRPIEADHLGLGAWVASVDIDVALDLPNPLKVLSQGQRTIEHYASFLIEDAEKNQSPLHLLKLETVLLPYH